MNANEFWVLGFGFGVGALTACAVGLGACLVAGCLAELRPKRPALSGRASRVLRALRNAQRLVRELP